jgi:dTDP-D-glucose 4,6-dehydratase
LIHLSSTAIYGNPAPGALITEHTPPQPSDEYAAIKLRQDRIVLGEHASRLHCIVLCPPTIFGPYSPFTVDVSESIREGRLPLLDGGTGFANLIHVDNLVHAIVTAMASDHGWGERYLVNEVEKISWVRFFEDMRLMLGAKSEFIKISSSQAGPMLSSGESRHRRGDSLRILVSGEFRAALSQFPIFRKLNEGAYKWFSSTRPWFQTWIRRRFQRPITISKQRIVAPVDQYFVRMQSRKVYFSPERLVGTFDYQPVLTYKQSMRTLRLWLEFANLI